LSRIRFPIETARLLLRPMTVADAEELHEVYSDPTTFRYIGNEPSRSIEETRERIAEKVRHQEEHGFALWAVCERASGRVVGDCGLQLLEGGPQVEVGYRLAHAVRGRGLATEAARASLVAGFDDLELDRIVAVAQPGNIASRRVMKKLGMTLMGLGQYYGSEGVLYAITRAQEAEASAQAE
jgi:[ribosomal protein S5]-alanine N-acetyltransferase